MIDLEWNIKIYTYNILIIYLLYMISIYINFNDNIHW